MSVQERSPARGGFAPASSGRERFDGQDFSLAAELACWEVEPVQRRRFDGEPSGYPRLLAIEKARRALSAFRDARPSVNPTPMVEERC